MVSSLPTGRQACGGEDDKYNIMSKVFLNFAKYLSVFALVFFCGVNLTLAKENSSVNVESRVSATASSGGNTISGSGTITTGDATASVKSVNIVDGGENMKIKNEVNAETGGRGSVASVEANGEKKACSGEDADSCKIEINTENSFESKKSDVQGEETVAAVAVEKTEKNISKSFYDFFSDVISEIMSWF
jgi:hypothetical protein